jgi:hypothetical protein
MLNTELVDGSSWGGVEARDHVIDKASGRYMMQIKETSLWISPRTLWVYMIILDSIPKGV